MDDDEEELLDRHVKCSGVPRAKAQYSPVPDDGDNDDDIIFTATAPLVSSRARGKASVQPNANVQKVVPPAVKGASTTLCYPTAADGVSAPPGGSSTDASVDVEEEAIRLRTEVLDDHDEVEDIAAYQAWTRRQALRVKAGYVPDAS